MSKTQLTLFGFVQDPDSGQSLIGLRVQAFDFDAHQSDYLGETYTGPDGSFTITFSPEQFQDSPHDQQPDLYFRVFKGDELLLDTSAEPLKNWQPGQEPVELLVRVAPAVSAPLVKSNEENLPFIVRGRIVQADGKGVSGVEVLAVDQGVGASLTMGRMETTERGFYQIQYTQKDLCPGKERADLIIRVVQEGKVLGASPLIINAYPEEEINVALGAEVFKGPSEFSYLEDRLRESLEKLKPEELTGRDISILSRKLRLDENRIAFYVKALRHAQQFSKEEIDAAVFYGLYRQGVSTSINVLLSQAGTVLARAIRRAAEDNQIDPALADKSAELAGRIKGAAIDLLFSTNDSIKDFLDLAGLKGTNREKFKDFLNAYHKEGGNFWNALLQSEKLNQATINQLRVTTQYAALTLNHLPLVREIKDTKTVKQPQDLVILTKTDWLGLIKKAGIPEGVPGNNQKQQQEWYAQAIIQMIEDVFPTAAFVQQWSERQAPDEFKTFFSKNPDFKLHKEKVKDYLAANPNALKGIADPDRFTRELKGIQTLFSIAPQYGKAAFIAPLLEAGIYSAHHIKLMGKSQFLQTLKGKKKSQGNEDYAMLYQRAMQMADTSLLAIMDYVDRYESLPAYVFPDLSATKAAAGIPSWDHLFGPTDQCACRHCHSVLSPAAYLVDLLVYLNGAKAGNDHSALKILANRRPDILNLDLSCDNALTPLPYIDLVNEVLERAISPINYGDLIIDGVSLPASDEVAQTEADTATLQAYPAHLRETAYQSLISEQDTTAFPWNLPFNLWQEETVLYLEHLGIQRHDLVRLFDQGRHEAWAHAYLNLIPETLDILMQPEADQDQLMIYWGGALEHIMEGSVRFFLELTGLSFNQLQQLTRCRFLGGPKNGMLIDMEQCSLEDARVIGLDEQLLHRLHRFERLRRLLGWEIYDLDRALAIFGNEEITPEVIIAIAGVQNLHKQFPQLSLAVILSWWSHPMDTWKYEEGLPSLFESIFLDESVNDPEQSVNGYTIEALFRLEEEFSLLALSEAFEISEQGVLSLCLGAVNLTETDYSTLLDAGELDDEQFRLDNLSYLFRLGSFLRAMGVSVREYLSLKALIGPIEDQWPLRPAKLSATPEESFYLAPLATLRYVEIIKALRSARIPVAELDYLLRHQQTPDSNIALKDPEITQILANVNGDIGQTTNQFQQNEEETDVVGRLEALLKSLFTGEHPEDTDKQVRQGLAIAEGSTVDNSPSVFAPYLEHPAKVEKILSRPPSIESLETRYQYIGEPLKQYLIKQQRRVSTAASPRDRLVGDLTTYFENKGPDKMVPEAMDIIERTTTKTFIEIDNFLKKHLLPIFVDRESLSEISASLGPLRTERYQILINAFSDHLLRSALEDVVIQRLATEIQLETSTMAALLRDHLQVPLGDSKTVQQRAIDQLCTIFSDSEKAISRDNFPVEYELVDLLYKIGLIIRRLHIPQRDLDFLFRDGPTYGLPDLLKLPIHTNNQPVSFEKWYLLWQLYAFQSTFSPDFSLISLLPLGPNVQQIANTLGQFEDWSASDISALLDDYLSVNFSNAGWLLWLRDAHQALQKSGSSASQLHAWAKTGSGLTPDHALAARNAAKGRHSKTEWPEIARSLRDPLREKQRDALEAFVMHQMGFRYTDELYAHFLIDTQTSSCMQTSRMVLAISSIQLFVQRIRMGLEAGHNIEFTDADIEEWPWRKNYRVWEANRKVFLWPENWIEPELRDDKTPFFRDLEDDLLQNEVNEVQVEQAYLHYLRKLDEVAQLEVAASYLDETTQVYHVIGRTHGLPHRYFYRQLINSSYWTAWEAIELDIQGDHIAACMHNRRLYLMWLNLEEKAREDTEVIPNTITPPEKYWEARLYWSEYKDGAWSAAKLSLGAARLENIADPKWLFMHTVNQSGHLKVYIYYRPPLPVIMIFQITLQVRACFQQDSCSNTFVPVQAVHSGTFEVFPYAGYLAQSYQSYEASPFTLLTGLNGQFRLDDILAADLLHRFHHPAADYHRRVSDLSFFYASDDRTYFVTTSTRLIFHASESTEEDDLEFELGDIDELTPSLIDHFRSKLPFESDKLPGDEPVDDVDPLPSGQTANDGQLYYQGNMGEQTIVIRSDRGPELTYFSEQAATTPKMKVKSMGLTAHQISDAELAHSPTEILRETGNNSWQTIQSERARAFQFHNFYHPYTCLFIKQLNRYGINGLLDPLPVDAASRNLLRQKVNATPFAAVYQPTQAVVGGYPIEDIDFSADGAYSQYNWELFFHAPFLIANRLMQDQQFETAQRWFHYIFDPTRVEGTTPQRFWMFKPFHDYANDAQADSLYRLFSEYSPSLTAQIQIMESDPFDPHAIARIRLVAYMKAVVMKYIDNLIAWGDYLFRQDSMESVNEATQLYVLAAQILGRRPEKIPEKEAATYTFLDLFSNDFQLLSNAQAELEGDLANQPTGQTTANGSSILSTMIYFCLPQNEQLARYWDIVADRLFKIRNCLNIEGVKRSLTLFQPPIDPGLLVRATAAGVDISSVLQDLNAPLPHYRFRFILHKANAYCNDVRSLGGALLSALEKKDGEELARIRAVNELDLLKAISAIKRQQVEESEENLNSLQQALQMAVLRREFYSQREFTNAQEQQQQKKLKKAHGVSQNAQLVKSIGGGLSQIPDADAGVEGVASSPVVKVKFGGSNWGLSYQLISGGLEMVAAQFSHEANKAAIAAGHIRRFEDWQHQARLAEREVKQIEYQIIAAEIRLEMAKKELQNHELQIEQSRQVYEFFRDKFTNQELYNWMTSQLSGLYFQAYNLAYDMAKGAERCFREELALPESNFIQFGYYDSLKKGLLAGERMQNDLRRLESAYLQHNKRTLEMTKHLSLKRLSPEALLQLKATGRCTFQLPEWLFDMDCPGHYLRRIKSVALSIPAIAGPYTSVNCTLTMLKGSVRTSPLLKNGVYTRQEEDNRFRDHYGGLPSIVTSSGQNDSGLFEVHLQDERYLPFENAGLVNSEWQLSLPAVVRQFDYNSISDVVCHIRYTARQGGEQLAEAATSYLQNEVMRDTEATAFVEMLSLKHDFPADWHRFLSDEAASFSARITRDHFPYVAQLRSMIMPVAALSLWEINSEDNQLVRLDNTEDDLIFDQQEFMDTGQSELEITRTLDKHREMFILIRYGLVDQS